MTHSWKIASTDLRDLALAADASAYRVGDYVRMRAVWRGGDGHNVRVSHSKAVDYARGMEFGVVAFMDLLSGAGVDPAMVDAARREAHSAQSINVDEDALTRAIEQSTTLTRHGFLEKVSDWILARGLDPRTLSGEVGWWRGRMPREDPTEAELWLMRSLHDGGPALMVPQRNALGRIKTFTLRFVDPPEGVPKTKYAPRTFAPTRGAHGTPFVYGWPHRDRDAVVIVGEGWAFPFEARTMLGKRRACVFAGRDAGSLGKCAPYVKGRRSRVVMVPDLNKVGLEAGAKFVASARALGVDAHLFDWDAFAKRTGFEVFEGCDLGDVVKARGDVLAREVFWEVCCGG